MCSVIQFITMSKYKIYDNIFTIRFFSFMVHKFVALLLCCCLFHMPPFIMFVFKSFIDELFQDYNVKSGGQIITMGCISYYSLYSYFKLFKVISIIKQTTFSFLAIL
jgi:hypothetical protein